MGRAIIQQAQKNYEAALAILQKHAPDSLDIAIVFMLIWQLQLSTRTAYHREWSIRVRRWLFIVEKTSTRNNAGDT